MKKLIRPSLHQNVLESTDFQGFAESTGMTGLKQLAMLAPQAGTAGRGEPLWRQIVLALRAPIISKAWPPGTRLPAETDLAEHFGVNRHTVRRAVRALVEDGLVLATRGRGTFVAGPARLVHPLGGWHGGHSESANRPGLHPQNLQRDVLKRDLVEAGYRLGEMLGVAPSTMLHEVEVRLCEAALPICLYTVWLPFERFAHFADSIVHEKSLDGALARLGVTQGDALRLRLSARAADAREQALLKLSGSQSLILSESLRAHRDGSALCCVLARYAAQRVQFVLDPGTGALRSFL